MTRESDTPRTDAREFYWTDVCTGNAPSNSARVVDADFARALERELAAANAENAVLRDAIKDALPWMIKLGDYIGNGTQADPMGRCNAILKMRIAVEKRDD